MKGIEEKFRNCLKEKYYQLTIVHLLLVLILKFIGTADNQIVRFVAVLLMCGLALKILTDSTEQMFGHLSHFVLGLIVITFCFGIPFIAFPELKITTVLICGCCLLLGFACWTIFDHFLGKNVKLFKIK